MSEKKLKDRVALITGASKGLGKSMAQSLARQGAKVILVSRTLTELEDVAGEIQAEGGSAKAIQTDATDESQVAELRDQVISEFGTLHILINNAGINNRKHLVDFTLPEWREILDANLTTAFLMCNAFVPEMKKNDYGRIINMTSILSHVALAGRTGYCTTKFGLLGFTKALALELVQEGITVNGISPGPFSTEMNMPIINDPEKNEAFLAKMPIGRWGNPKEIGELAVYLCSEDAGFITGTDIVIDGAWTAQ